ncbi:MAG: hypothetical protein GY814_20360 [Gammaproteobacteria bacterium]|nr:hypothetical protein [Gammaproteobacteria bacterium]
MKGTGGDFEVMVGDGDDPVSSYLNSKISGVVPAYKSMVQVIFQQFYFGMNPYIKPVAFEIERYPDNIAGPTASAESEINGDANPAQIIYECITNAGWGMGYTSSSIDSTSFQEASTVLYNEGFGLSLIWSESIPIEDFIQEIRKHINADLYLDRTTGKFVLKLIRDDYDPGTLPLFDQTNIVDMEGFSRKLWGETINEITLIYTNREGKSVPITVQDIGNIQVQGTTINQKVEFPGITNEDLALRVAQRELQSRATPLAKLRFRVNRQAWDLNVADPIRVSWPNYGITEVIFRVISISYGNLKDSHIHIDAIEDVFGLPDSSYGSPQESGWVEPRTDPQVPANRGVVESNYWDLVQGLGELGAIDFITATPEDGYYLCYAVKPETSHYNYQVIERPWWDGSGYPQDYVEGTEDINEFAPFCELEFDMDVEDASVLTYVSDIDMNELPLAELVLIDDEYMQVWAIDTDNSTLNVYRGMLDTVPMPHSAGTAMYGIQSNQAVSLNSYTDMEAVDLKFITKSGGGTLPELSAELDSFTFTGRAGRPWPPGGIRVDGLSIFQSIGMTLDDLSVTWAHRDKTLQTGEFVYQDEASVGPEVGVTYTVALYNEEAALVSTVTDIAGDTFTWVDEVVDSGLGRLNNNMTIKVSAVLWGVSSHQDLTLDFTRADYGFSYGVAYGGYV